MNGLTTRSVWQGVSRCLSMGGFSLLVLCGCGHRDEERTVVVYTSQDQVYATQILDAFTRETGIQVLPLFDSESVKTTGLMNRLIAERQRPRCDVFWSNEELMVRRLAKEGVVEASAIRTFGYRSRRLVVNTNRVTEAELPGSLLALTDPKWRRRVALAYPLYGTTVTHLMALRSDWGRERWRAWCDGLLSNQSFVVDGNSAVVRMVGRGEAWLGLTDSDDIAVGLRNGLPIRQVELSDEFPTISNSAVTVIGGPHPEEAGLLIEYLQRESTLEQLVALGALEGVTLTETNVMTIRWDHLMAGFDEAYEWLGEAFFR